MAVAPLTAEPAKGSRQRANAGAGMAVAMRALTTTFHRNRHDDRGVGRLARPQRADIT
jgi:hypothetical protein